MLPENEREQIKRAVIGFAVDLTRALQEFKFSSMASDEAEAVWNLIGATSNNYLEVIARPKKQIHASKQTKSAGETLNTNTVVTE